MMMYKVNKMLPMVAGTITAISMDNSNQHKNGTDTDEAQGDGASQKYPSDEPYRGHEDFSREDTISNEGDQDGDVAPGGSLREDEIQMTNTKEDPQTSSVDFSSKHDNSAEHRKESSTVDDITEALQSGVQQSLADLVNEMDGNESESSCPPICKPLPSGKIWTVKSAAPSVKDFSVIESDVASNFTGHTYTQMKQLVNEDRLQNKRNGDPDAIKKKIGISEWMSWSNKTSEALIIASEMDDSDQVQQLLDDSTIVVNTKSADHGCTALHVAAQHGHNDVLRQLLSHRKIQVNPVDKEGRTALYVAAQEGHSEVVEKLLGHSKIDVNKTDVSSFRGGLKALFDNRDDVHKSMDPRSTPLNIACQYGHVTVVQHLLTHPKINVTKMNIHGVSPLFNASLGGHVEIVRMLLSRSEVIVNQKDAMVTPLWIASQNGHHPVVKELLSQPTTDVNKARSTDGMTPLFLGSQNGHDPVVKELLSHPTIDVNKASTDDATPLYMASDNGHDAVVKLLLSHPNIDVNKATSDDGCNYYYDGCTPLWMASQNGHDAVVKELLSHPTIDVNKARTTDDVTPLFMASQKGYDAVVKELLSHPTIDVNKARTTDDVTPLFKASYNGHDEVVKELLSHPTIDVNKARDSGSTPLYKASQHGHDEVVKELLSHPTIDVNKARTTDDVTPLFMASYNGHDEVVKELLSHPTIDVDKARSTDDSTPLIMASHRGHLETVQILLGHSEIDVNHVNNDGETAMSCASSEGHEAIVNAIRNHPSYTNPQEQQK